MSKFEIGDKVVVVDAKPVYDTYKNGDTGVVVAYDECSAMAGYVRREDGVLMNVYWHEVELVEGEKDSTGAESLRNSILDIRSKREALQKEILRLDEQEKEAVEELKELGFVLYENNVSKELDVKEVVATENKAVLYADDIEEDMSSCENWKKGDILEVITHTDSMIPFGALVRHDDFDGDDHPYTRSEYSSKWAIDSKYLKFHSRPVK